MPFPSLTVRFRRIAFALAIALSAAATPAPAFDLDPIRVDASRLATALALGKAGDWEAAELEIAASTDPVLHDILLWRKLRAGDGTTAEYAEFAARRSSWPGQDILRKSVLGDVDPPSGSYPLTGDAAAAYAEFDKAWRSRDWPAAEATIIAASSSFEALGDPGRWAVRRRSLARRAQREGRYEAAYEIASQHYLASGRSFADLEWLAGWISLRFLDDPGRAVGHFMRFYADVETPISLGRGGYWIGRAYEALGDTEAAMRWYREGGRHQTSFYGQLAAAKSGMAGDPAVAGGPLPAWETSPALRSDDIRAALIIYYAGETNLAKQFFVHLANSLPGEPAIGALADLALDLGEHSFAVKIAKVAARRGFVIHTAYYPVTPLASFQRGVESALALSIARQETEHDPRAVSPAGARGLMQLMPGTAKIVATQLGLEYDRSRLLDDWQYNATLGQTYLADQIDRFAGSYVMAAAAYNAGPHRVDQWISEYGDPRLGSVDLIDWMETVPFEETRNYMQRVVEGLYVYRSRISGVAGPMTIEQDLARGRF